MCTFTNRFIQAAGNTSDLPSKTVSGTSLRSEHSPSGFHSFGAHGDRLPPSSRDLGYALSRRLTDSPFRPSSLLTTSGPAGSSTRYPVSRNLPTFGLRGSLGPRVQSSGDSSKCVQAVPPSSLVLSSSGQTHGFTQLGLRSYPSGSFVPETITMLFSFFRSDRSVYTAALVRPLGPCQLTSMAGPVFSYLWNPYPSVSGGIYDFHVRLQSGLGRPHGGFPNFGYMGPSGPPAPYQLPGTQGGRGCSTSLGPGASGPPGDDCYGQFNSSFLYQQTRRDSVPHLVRSGSGAFL